MLANEWPGIQEEKEYLSSYVEKKYDIEETKQKLEDEIKAQQINIEILQELKKVEDDYNLKQEKIKVGQNTIKEYKRKIEELTYPKNVNVEGTIGRPQKISDFTKILISIALTILALISIFVIKNDVISAITIVLAIISVIYVSYEQYKQKIAKEESKHSKNVDNKKVIAQIEAMQEVTNNLEKEQEELKKTVQKEYDEKIEKIRNNYIGIAPIKVIDELLSRKNASIELEVAQNKIGENKLKIQSIGLDKANILPKLENLALLEEEYALLEEEYQRLIFQNTAIELAKQELEKAYYQMKNKIAPKFTNELSNIMQKISNGKYTNIKLDENDELIVEIQNGDYISAHLLSIGTIDQLYLSLRLGAAYQISNEDLPIILDEAFAYYDDERLKNILKFLNSEYPSRQIIILSCTEREKNILENENIQYNLIEL